MLKWVFPFKQTGRQLALAARGHQIVYGPKLVIQYKNTIGIYKIYFQNCMQVGTPHGKGMSQILINVPESELRVEAA